MFITQNQPSLTVPVGEGTVFDVQGSAAESKTVKIMNLDDTNTLTYKFQYSDDGTTWTDVAALSTVAPADWLVTTLTAHVFHRLRAYGNLDIAVEVSMVLSPSTRFTFVNL